MKNIPLSVCDCIIKWLHKEEGLFGLVATSCSYFEQSYVKTEVLLKSVFCELSCLWIKIICPEKRLSEKYKIDEVNCLIGQIKSFLQLAHQFHR